MSSLDEAPSDYSYGEDDDVMSDEDDDYGFDTDVEGKKVRARTCRDARECVASARALRRRASAGGGGASAQTTLHPPTHTQTPKPNQN